MSHPEIKGHFAYFCSRGIEIIWNGAGKTIGDVVESGGETKIGIDGISRRWPCPASFVTDNADMADTSFWSNLDRLLAQHRLVIDRPKGSVHPRFPDFRYPLDYGYLDGTSGGDGGGIDVWVGSLPDRRLEGVVCTVDLDKRDTEVKLLLGCTSAEMQMVLATHNSGPQGGVLFQRPIRA
jgi:inorganic pyrophosphatase